jgi:hypothetical protein
MMRMNFGLICDYAVLNASQQLCMLGVSRHVLSSAIAGHDRVYEVDPFYLAAEIHADPAEDPIAPLVRLVNEDGVVGGALATAELHWYAAADGTFTATFIHFVTGLCIPSRGKYSFQFLDRDRIIGTIPVWVVA